jgi:SPP1 gp7 family putative phage head morphogenesis protein
MPNAELYQATDKAIALLARKAIRRFEKARKAANLLDFDELEVIQTCKDLYKSLDSDNRKAFLELAVLVYKEAEPNGGNVPDKDWLDSYLLEYCPVTKYVYDHEVSRKREYLQEAIISSTAKAVEYRKALSRWSSMTAQYADEVTDKATLKAFKDAGIERVQWNAQLDEKTCETCRERHGMIYPIDSVPPKPHWRCRCTLTPIKGKRKLSHSEFLNS